MTGGRAAPGDRNDGRIAILAVPLVIITVALIPVFVTCAFLASTHRHQMTGLLADPQQWTGTFARPRQRHEGREGPVPAGEQ